MPVVDRQVGEPPARRRDAGVVDREIQPEGLVDGFNRLADRLLIGDVGGERKGLPARFADDGGRQGGLLLVDIEDAASDR